MRRLLAAALAFAALALIANACSSSASSTSGGSSSSTSTSAGRPTTTAAALTQGELPVPPTPAERKACDGYQGGQAGVLRTFCQGAGSAQVTLDGNVYGIFGASCAVVGPTAYVDGGVAVDSSFHGLKPELLAVALPAQAGAFHDVPMVLQLAGQVLRVRAAGSRSADGSTGQFTATTAGGHGLSGTWRCHA
jgi:hypothetical protein